MRKYLRSILALLLAAVLAAPPALAADTAAAIRLSKTEGTVTVSNSGGKTLSTRADMRLYNGYSVSTDAAGYAWISLDDEKLNKLDELSEAEVRKSGKLLELLLNSGNLYFNVTTPLEEEESLNIRTSTMVVGIRGTCGWVKMVDQYNTEVSVLEGTVWCTITDPVSGQTKTTALSGGETARFTVYDEERQDGERCAIIRDRFAEPDIDGFVLAELVGDGPMCDKIYTDSGLDLRDLTQEEVRERLEEDQRAAAENVSRQEKLENSKENHISITPVWGGQTSGGSGDSGGGSGGGAAPSPAPSVVRLTMPVTDMAIQQELDKPSTRQVIVSPGPAGSALDIGISMHVDAGKTLTLERGVPAQVLGSLTVDGTADLGDDLENLAGGTVTVRSANTLRVGGNLTNRGQFTVTASGRSVTEGTFAHTGTMTLTEGARVLCRGGFTLTAEIIGWRVAAEKSDGYFILEAFVPQKSTLTLNFNNGQESVTVETDDNGRLTAPLPVPTDPDGGEFQGWYTEDGSADESKRVTEDTQFTGDTDLYAVWKRNAGDFAVTGGTAGTDYDYAGNTLTVKSAAPLTIAMKEGVTQTATDSILVADGVNANITLAGVNIDLSAADAAAFKIADDSTGDVTVTLKDGSTNVLKSGHAHAGLEKASTDYDTAAGTLTITGSGALEAAGGNQGAGIGGSLGYTTKNIVISGGRINAASGSSNGVGIGYCNYGDGGSSDITVTGGEITGDIGITDGQILISGNAVVNGRLGGDSDTDRETSVVLSGGTVSGNVHAENSFSMTGGTITGYVTPDIFTMDGGTVNGNVGAFTFTMTDGTVNGDVTAEDFTLNGGTIQGSVSAWTSLTMTGGEIASSGNTTLSALPGGGIQFQDGILTNDSETGYIFSLSSGDRVPDVSRMTIRGKNDDLFLRANVPFLPDGCTVEGPRDDGYYYLVPVSAAAGAFTVSGDTAAYSYADGVLTVSGAAPLTIRNTDQSTPTTDHIAVADGVSANITLAGVNIDTSGVSGGAAAFKIANDSMGNVTVTLADGTENTLKSGGDYAGLSKRVTSDPKTLRGLLTIQGNGRLNASAGSGGAGIGADSSGTVGIYNYYNTNNINITGGTIVATGGTYSAGIGGGNKSDVYSITISGAADVTATGGYCGAGIGGGRESQHVSNITISGSSTVRAEGGAPSGIDGGAGIGGGAYGEGSDITISDNANVTATGSGGGAGIGGGTRYTGGGSSTVSGGTGNDITISGGTVTATGGEYGGAGIGGGGGSDGHVISGKGGSALGITISGGTVTAAGGTGAPDIGAGYGTSSGNSMNIGISGQADVTGTILVNNAGAFTMSGGEVKSDRGNTVAAASGVTMNLAGGTITCDAANFSALSMGNTADFPDPCGTVIRGKSFAMQSLPSGYENKLQGDGYYHLMPRTRTTLESAGLATNTLQTALDNYDEVYISGSNTVILSNDLTLPAGKVLTTESGVTLQVGNNATATINGSLDVGNNLQVYGTLNIGESGAVKVLDSFWSSGTLNNAGRLALQLTGRSFTSTTTQASITNTGTIDFNSPNSLSIEGTLNNSGTLMNVTSIALRGTAEITDGMVSASGTGGVFQLSSGAALRISGGEIVQTGEAGHLVFWGSGAEDAVFDFTGGSLRGKNEALLWQYGVDNSRDVTVEKGYRAALSEDGNWYELEKQQGG